MLEGLSGTLEPKRRTTTRVVAGAIALALIAWFGVIVVFRFVADERVRELRVWQVRLGITADSRAAAVSDWLERQMATVGGLAENTSLQLYMTELSLAGGDPSKVTEEAAQAGYLRNLLIVTADRAGFTSPPVGPRVDANVQRVGVAGIALLDVDGQVLVATPDMPPIAGRLRSFIVDARRGQRAIEDMFLDAAGRPSMGFLEPILPLQGDPGSQQIGWVLGLKEVWPELIPLLTRPPLIEKTAESILVRPSGPVVEFLSPLLNEAGTQQKPLQRKLSVKTPDLAEAFAIAAPGDFSIKRDYRDVEVLVTGRAIALAPWTLVHKVDREEALADNDARLNRLLIMLLLAIAALTLAVVAVWRHGASRRATEAAERFAALARRFESQGQLLRLVTDSQSAAIFIADAENKLRFANQVAAARAGVPPDDLIGKTLASVFGSAVARRYEDLNREAIAKKHAQPAVHRDESGGQVRVFHSEHIPLPAAEGGPSGVLVVEDDITMEIVERERRERILRQLVRTLVTVVDRRDPFAANHSQRVAAVARRVAEEMGLDRTVIETAEIAGNLLNLGKILVPPQLLTRTGVLTDEEKRQIRESIQAGADLVEGIEFDGPVVETMRQAQERWDGSGPKGLKDEAILVSARVVAVANAFVAMVSPRAHRPGIDFDAAAETLFRQSGTSFDRRVVVALVNDLDNRGGRARWAEFATMPKDATRR
ncbi:MAG: PAS domain-containing protein [Proteobacteria bacterium]|nr:PAS domain-containing protein [Pseudomonadota bacterium]